MRRWTPQNIVMKMKPANALTAFLTGAALLAMGQSMAAAFYLTQVGTPRARIATGPA